MVGRFIYIYIIIFSINISILYSQKPLFENPNIFYPEFNDIRQKNVFSNSYYFLSPYNSQEQYLTIFDQQGTPVFIKELKSAYHSFQVQKNGYISFYNSETDKFNLVDSSFNLIETYDVTSEYTLDWHEFLITEDNHAILIGKDYRLVDMDSIINDGGKEATVVGLVIQEFDKQNEVIFEWRSWDYFNITDTYIDLGAQTIDYVHANAIEIDFDGNLLLSSRNMSEVTKINKKTGELIWRLGGKNNEFTFKNDDGFSFQHSVRRLPNGNITLFDNGNLKDEKISRGVEYEIDEKNKTVKLVKEFKSDSSVFSIWMGNMQNLPNGNRVIGWGKNNNHIVFSEFNDSGDEILQASTNDQYLTYRAFRFPWKTNLLKSDKELLDFGTVSTEQDSVINIMITNNADYQIEISGYSTLDSVFTISSDFPVKLPAKREVVLPVKFAPMNNGGEVNDILTIHSDSIFDSGLGQRIAIQISLSGYVNDISSPRMNIYPQQNDNDIPVDTSMIIYFDEPVRKLNNEELNPDNLDEIITLEKVSGNIEIPILASVNDERNKITVQPDIDLEYGEHYRLCIDAMIEDYYDNAINDTIINFSTEIATFISSENDHGLIYPNPTSGKFYLNSHKKVFRIELYDRSGVLKKTIINNKIKNNIAINISDLSMGLYFLKIFTEDNKIMQYKVLKN